MKDKHFLRTLYNHYYPNSFLFPLEESSQNLSTDEKIKKSFEYYNEGLKKFSLQDSLFIKDFDASLQLDFTKEERTIHIALLLTEWGISSQDEKILIFADFIFGKMTTTSFPLQYTWGKALLKLYDLNKKTRFLKNALEQFQKAQTDIQKAPQNLLHTFYWDLGLLWSKMGQDSGEALDVRKAIQALRVAATHEKNLNKEFYFDFGSIYLQMMNLINDPALSLKALDSFNEALKLDPLSYTYLNAIAGCYISLYFNTLDQKYFNSAESFLDKCLKQKPSDTTLLLKWAQLLFESAKINQNVKKMRLALEKIHFALTIDKTSYLLLLEQARIKAYIGAYTNSFDLLVDAEKSILSLHDHHPHDKEVIITEGFLQHAFYLYYQDILYEEKALEKFTEAQALNTQDSSLWHLMGQSLTILGKQTNNIEVLKKACVHYQKALHLKAISPGLHYDYALLLLILSDFTAEEAFAKEAIEQLEITLSIQKEAILQHPEWLFHYGVAHDLLSDLTEEESGYFKAVEILHQVLLIDPDYPKMHLTLGSAYAHLAESSFDKEYFHEAMKFFQMAQKQNPEEDEVYLEWALAYISLALQSDGDEIVKSLYKKAEELLMKSATLGNQECYYHLACLYSLNERFDLSLQFLQKAAENQVLPSIEEMKEDEWLDALQFNEQYKKFISELETKQHFFDEK